MSPAPVALTAQVWGKGCPLVDGAHGAEFPDRNPPREMHLPNPRGETGRGENAKTERWPSG